MAPKETENNAYAYASLPISPTTTGNEAAVYSPFPPMYNKASKANSAPSGSVS